MGADRLWEMTLEQNGRMDAVEFLRWRWRHGLSLTQAAEALDLSRRQVAYYASGERPVPRYVLLALKGWELERKELAAWAGRVSSAAQRKTDLHGSRTTINYKSKVAD
jgi:hypothetical protein